MDFWQFGIYIVILSGASALVIMTIALIVRKMDQDRSPKARSRSKAAALEWAQAPQVGKMRTSPTSLTPNNIEQNETSHDERIQPEPAPESAKQDAIEEISLTSPLSTPGTVEPNFIGGTSMLDTSGAPDALLTGVTNAIPEEEDSQVNEEDDTAGNEDSDPLSIFHMEDNQENPISELSASLPDIDIFNLLRESKEVMRILGIETEEESTTRGLL